MGTFTNQIRWNKAPKSPGVGDYDLTGFKSFAKASETVFEIPKKQTNVASSGEKGYSRPKSVMQRSENGGYERSRSPPTRKLGGPQHPNMNYMMQTTRLQRTLLFSHENESALLNSIG